MVNHVHVCMVHQWVLLYFFSMLNMEQDTFVNKQMLLNYQNYMTLKIHDEQKVTQPIKFNYLF